MMSLYSMQPLCRCRHLIQACLAAIGLSMGLFAWAQLPPVDLAPLPAPVREAVALAYADAEQLLSQEGVSTSLRAAALARAGDVLLVHGLSSQARQLYTQARDLSPQVLDWHYLLGVLESGEGRIEAALIHFEAALAIDAWDLATLVRRGRLHLEAGDAAAADRDFQRVLRLDPDSPAALAGLGQTALALGQADLAVERLERALLLAPAARQLYQPLGMAYRERGALEAARRALQAVGAGEPGFPDPVMDRVRSQSRSAQFYQEMGLAAADAGQWMQARNALVTALTLSPNDPLILSNYGEILVQEGELDEARQAFTRLTELQPDQPQPWLYLGQLEELAGRPQAAGVAYQRGLAVAPDNPSLREGLAFVALAEGHFVDAERQFAALAGDAQRLRYWQAMAQLGQGQCEAPEALLRAQQATEEGLDPAIMDALARLWSSCAEGTAEQLQTARNWAERLYDAQPSIDSAATLAMVMAALGQFADAEDFQGQALFEALRDGRLDQRPDLLEDMQRYRQQRRAERPYAPTHPVFTRMGLPS